MKRMVKKGFTLVEILIVVIILGILAAIVIPQFTEASAEARISNLVTNLQTVRSQLLLYKTQHIESYPGAAGTPDLLVFGPQMTQYTDAAGNVSPVPTTVFLYGPYLQQVPINPINGLDTVNITDTAADVNPESGLSGWWLNRITGEFRANLADTWVKPDGTILNTL
jgi:general secretion pathway protein G